MAKAETLLEQNAAEALKLIAASADVALQKVALAQSLVKPTNGLSTKDHDDLTKLIKSVDDFHEEMRRILAHWREDYHGQLDDHENRILTLEFSNTKQTVLLTVGIGILTLLTSVVLYKIFHA